MPAQQIASITDNIKIHSDGVARYWSALLMASRIFDTTIPQQTGCRLSGGVRDLSRQSVSSE